MRFTLRIAMLPVTGVGVLLGMSPAAASDYWEYKNWSVATAERITEEHDWLDCSAWTGGDGDALIALEVTRDHIGPPDSYPQITMTAVTPRGLAPTLQNGQPIAFIIDQKAAFYGLVHTDYNEDRLLESMVQVRWDMALDAIRWMQAGTHLDLHLVRPYDGGEHLMRASLAGFTAAYGKMMDECGYSLELREVDIDYN